MVKIIIEKNNGIKANFICKSNKKDCCWKAIAWVTVAFPRSEAIQTTEKEKSLFITNIS